MFPDVNNNIAMPTLTKEIINAAILGFEEQRRRLDDQIAELRAMLPGSSVLTPKPRPTVNKKRRMSAAGRKAIAEAQRKRWAVSRSKSEPKALKAAKPKRKLSAAGRAAIVAALKKRWAVKRAAAKKAA
jgi:hypothetical protein